MQTIIHCKDDIDLQNVLDHTKELGCFLQGVHTNVYFGYFTVVIIDDYKVVSIGDINFLSDIKKNIFSDAKEYYANEFLDVKEI